jgi:hypothetical protein
MSFVTQVPEGAVELDRGAFYTKLISLATSFADKRENGIAAVEGADKSLRKLTRLEGIVDVAIARGLTCRYYFVPENNGIMVLAGEKAECGFLRNGE